MNKAVRKLTLRFLALLLLMTLPACPVGTGKSGSGNIFNKSNGSGGGVGSGEGIGGVTETRDVIALNFNSRGPASYGGRAYRYAIVRVKKSYPSNVNNMPPTITEEYYQVEGVPNIADTTKAVGGTRVNAPTSVTIGNVVATLSDSSERTYSTLDRPGLIRNQYLLRVAVLTISQAGLFKPGMGGAILYDPTDQTVALTIQASANDTPIVVPPTPVTITNHPDGSITYTTHYAIGPVAGYFYFDVASPNATTATVTYHPDNGGPDITATGAQSFTLD